MTPITKAQLHARLSGLMAGEVERLFEVPVLVTLIVRDPHNQEMEIVTSSDTIEGIRGAITRCSGRPPITSISDVLREFHSGPISEHFDEE